ncbi:MAG: tetratricopeptide repeat protein [Pseudomonadota bacterium]
MSLLLDAMKKTEQDSQKSGLSNLSLEEHPVEKMRTPPLPEAVTSSSRAAGENIFAAKRKKEAPRFRWNLGLVPTTLLICSVIGSGYGYYVYLEITPTPQAFVQRSNPTPPPTPVAAPTPQPQLVATLAPQPGLEVPQSVVVEQDFASPKAKPFAPTVSKTSSADSSKNSDKQAKPRAENSPKQIAPKPPAAMTIVRSQERDSITPALLDAYQAYQRNDYVSATQGYRNVLSQDAHNRDALLGLGAIAQQQGQNESAQYYYRQVLLLDPRDPVAQGAMFAYSTNIGVDTESQIKQRLSEHPRSAALNYALGNLYSEQSRWAEAQQAYFNAHTLDQSNAQYKYNLAVSLDHLGQSKAAAQYYQQALQLDSGNNSGFDHASAQQRLNELTPPSR